jgi:hypothetical protein
MYIFSYSKLVEPFVFITVISTDLMRIIVFAYVVIYYKPYTVITMFLPT